MTSSSGWSTSTSTTARSEGASTTPSTSSACSIRPLSPPTSFIRAPGKLRLNTRVLAVLVSHNRTTSPACASNWRSGSPLVRNTLPKRPIAAWLVSIGLNGAILPSSSNKSSTVKTNSRSTSGQ